MKGNLAVRNFNKLWQNSQNQTLIRKALSSDTGKGEALIPQNLEQVITNTLVRLVPELNLPTLRFDPQKFHEFNRLVKIPKAGSAMGESSTTPTRNSETVRDNVQLKILKRKGSVTGFLQASSEAYVDAMSYEVETHVQSLGNDMRTYLVWGNAVADQYTFSGLDFFIATDRVQLTSADTKVQTNLKILDDRIDKSNRRQAAGHKRVLLMSPELNSQLTRLYTNVRDNRATNRTANLMEAVDGGFRFESYRGIPIIETTATRPVSQMGAVGAAFTGGGSITDDEYFFVVAPVTWDGEQGGSAEASVATTSASSIDLTWTAEEDALYYRIYCGLATGQDNLKLVRVISAFQYDSAGTITGDTVGYSFTADPTVADNSVPAHMQNDLYLDWNSGKPEEVLIFWDLDEHQGLGKMAYTNPDGSKFRNLVSVEPLAKVDDAENFLLKSYPALVPSFEKTSGLIRGLKTEA